MLADAGRFDSVPSHRALFDECGVETAHGERITWDALRELRVDKSHTILTYQVAGRNQAALFRWSREDRAAVEAAWYEHQLQRVEREGKHPVVSLVDGEAMLYLSGFYSLAGLAVLVWLAPAAERLAAVDLLDVASRLPSGDRVAFWATGAIVLLSLVTFSGSPFALALACLRWHRDSSRWRRATLDPSGITHWDARGRCHVTPWERVRWGSGGCFAEGVSVPVGRLSGGRLTRDLFFVLGHAPPFVRPSAFSRWRTPVVAALLATATLAMGAPEPGLAHWACATSCVAAGFVPWGFDAFLRHSLRKERGETAVRLASLGERTRWFDGAAVADRLSEI